MNTTIVKQRNDIALRKIIDAMIHTIVESLGSFMAQPLSVEPAGELECIDLDEFLEAIEGTRIVIRGVLDGFEDEHHLLVVLDLVDAITLCGNVMLTSDDVIEENRQKLNFEQEHHEAFVEVGNIVCSAISGVLRRDVGSETGLCIRDYSIIEPGLDPAQILGIGPALAYGFNLRIGQSSETRMSVLLDHEVGQSWNGKVPLFEFGDEAAASLLSGKGVVGSEQPAQGQEAQKSRRTTLSTFVTSPGLAPVIKECCTGLDLKIQRHARTDIPNPAAHRGEIVLIEIPVGEEKRFEWARRLKQYHRDLPVVLLIHEPSRPRVVQGLLTRANVILAWPSTGAQLKAKLEPLIEIDSPEGEA